MEFKTQTFTVADLYNWYRNGELVLAPRFQRRLVWSSAARSYLIDTVARGLPMPKIFFRMQIDPEEVASIREVVDGQQRLDALFDFIQGEFAVQRAVNPLIGGKRFAELPPSLQSEILSYDVSADLLIGVSDALVLQIFSRINSYSVTLSAQETRNAKFAGVFKNTAYSLGTEHLEFWRTHKILSDQNIARMQEAELTSELMIGLLAGLQDKKASIDRFYALYEDRFPDERSVRSKFEKVMSWIDANVGPILSLSAFSRRALFYSLFLAAADALFGIPGGDGPIRGLERHSLPVNAQEKLKRRLETLSTGIRAKEPPRDLAAFALAAARQTDNIAPRRIRHHYILRAIAAALK